jgi:hypothetical protein
VAPFIIGPIDRTIKNGGDMRTWAMERTVVAIGLGLPFLATGALLTAQGGGRGERIAEPGRVTFES